MEEFLHQLVDGFNILWYLYLQCFIVSNSYQLVQDFFHPPYVHWLVEVPKSVEKDDFFDRIMGLYQM